MLNLIQKLSGRIFFIPLFMASLVRSSLGDDINVDKE